MVNITWTGVYLWISLYPIIPLSCFYFETLFSLCSLGSGEESFQCWYPPLNYFLFIGQANSPDCLYALKRLKKLLIWDSYSRKKIHLLLHSDNKGGVLAINCLSSKFEPVVKLLKQLVMYCLCYNIWLKFSY